MKIRVWDSLVDIVCYWNWVDGSSSVVECLFRYKVGEGFGILFCREENGGDKKS